jgi:VIT1/CCC1 family predicted Fe2+/Mn2+ transporter
MVPLLGKVTQSLRESIGDVAFGMSDGAVSVAGLVFGVAASTGDVHIVLLAGATGAVAGAVSMMAGTYLDAQSRDHRADAVLGRAERRLADDPEPFLRRAEHRLHAQGYEPAEIATVVGALRRDSRALREHVVAYEVGIGNARGAAPWTHAVWMFVADILAASVPVLPFAIFDMTSARLVSLVITGVLMASLGYARGRIGHVNVIWTMAQTMTIAGAAALAGVAIGHFVSL